MNQSNQIKVLGWNHAVIIEDDEENIEEEVIQPVITTKIIKKKISVKNMKFYKSLLPVLKLKGKYTIGQDIQYTDDKNEITTVKQYNIVKSIDELEALVGSNNNLYELVPEETPLRIYFDLEIETELTEEQEQERLNIFITWMKEQFENNFNNVIDTKDIVILKSSKKNKMSYHIVIQKYYFNDCYNLKNWIDYITSIIKNTDLTEELEKLVWYKGDKQKFIMDSAPYGKNRLFRMVGQSKIGSNVSLKLITNHTIKETFLTLDTITEKDILLTFDKAETAFPHLPSKKTKTKKETKSLFIKNNLDDDFINNENCLMNYYKMDYNSLVGQKGGVVGEPLVPWKQYLYLIPNNSVSWETWMKIGYAIRYCGGVKQDWVDWSKLSKNYKMGECNDFEKFFIKGAQGFGDEKKCYNIYTLRKLAKIAHPAFFKTQQQCFSSLFDMDLDGVNVIEEKSKFLSQEGTSDENNILNNAKINILYAFLGKGKTTAIKRLININKYDSILCLSPRQAFAQFLSADFGISCYLDGVDTYKEDKLVISVESLYKIDINKKYDLIVLDESESILNQFSSPTMKARYLEIYNVLINLMQNAKKVILADAFISNRTINFAKSFDESITMIKNNTQPIQREAIEIEKDDFEKVLIDDIKKGNKNYICYSSKKDLTVLKGILKATDTDFYNKALFYYGKGDDDVFEGLKNINETWTEASIVSTTPTITVGNSYSVEDHFNKVFINGAPTCSVRDTFQSQMRVRHLKDNKLIFSLPTSKQYNYYKNRNLLYFDVLEQFDEYNESKKEMLINLIDEVDKDNETLKELKLKIETIEQTPKALREILFFNLLEYSISNTYYNDLFYHYLTKCGYHLKNAKEIKKKNEKKEEKEPEYFYDDIEDINRYTAEFIADLEKKKQASEASKLQKDKYYFKKIVDEELIQETSFPSNDYWFEYYLNGAKRQFLDNARIEFKNNIKQNIKNDILGCGDVIEQNHLKSLQFKYICELNKGLDIENSFKGGEISLEKIKGLSSYLKTHRKNIHDVFKMRDQSATDITPSNELNLNIKFLTKIYKQWNDTEFKAIKTTKDSKSLVGYTKTGCELYKILKQPIVKPIVDNAELFV